MALPPPTHNSRGTMGCNPSLHRFLGLLPYLCLSIKALEIGVPCYQRQHPLSTSPHRVTIKLFFATNLLPRFESSPRPPHLLITVSPRTETVMPTFDGGFPIDDDGDIELFEVPHKRRTEVDSPKHNQSDLLPESQAQATPSHEHLFWGLDKLPSKTPVKNHTDEETNTTTTLVCEDEIMTDTIAELTEKGFVKLPSLRQVLPRGVHAPEPEENIDRPYYNEYYHCEGFVAWWDNKTGKGMIIDHRNKFEHKIGTHISELFFPILYYTSGHIPGAQSSSSSSRDLLSSTQ